jgi:hypothetical protein
VTGEFDVQPHERELLAEVCRVLDTCDSLAAAAARDGPVTTGSKGQTVTHPAVGELRQQRLAGGAAARTARLAGPGG